METWIFWGLAAAVIVAALLVVAQRRAERAIRMVALLLGAVAGLLLLLSAPVAAIALVMCAGALMVTAWPVVAFLDPPDESSDGTEFTAGAGVRRFGVLLAIGLMVELAWAFQQVLGAPLPPAAELPARGLAAVGGALVTDYSGMVLLAMLLLLATVAGGVLLIGRESR